MKFAQLIEYNLRYIFREKPCPIYDGKLVPDPFFKSQCFYCSPSRGLTKCTQTKVLTTCFILIESFFKKRKETWN